MMNDLNEIQDKEVREILRPNPSPDVINRKVSKFVERIRMQQRHDEGAAQNGPGNQQASPAVMQGRVVVLGLDEARQQTDDHILQAEQFKVAITQPSGMVPN